MEDIKKYLEYISINNNIKLYIIIDYIINNFNYLIIEDTVSHDIRTIILKKNRNEITIVSTFIFNRFYQRKNNILIKINNNCSYVFDLDY
jgi:hypothetical protein